MSKAAGGEAADAAPARPKKSKLVPILLGVIVLMAVGGGAGGYWMYTNRSAQPAEPPPPPKPGVVDLKPPFVVNLADEGGGRFLRVSMQLLTYDEEQAKEVAESPVTSAKVRSAVVELLSRQLAEELITPEGKKALKEEIAHLATEAAATEGEGGKEEDEEHHFKVIDVLFAEFVVQ